MCNGSISFQTELTLCQASYLHFSGSTCIITLANHYDTSVDAAVVQRLENPFQAEHLKERLSAWNPTVSLVGQNINDFLLFQFFNFSLRLHPKNSFKIQQ